MSTPRSRVFKDRLFLRLCTLCMLTLLSLTLSPAWAKSSAGPLTFQAKLTQSKIPLSGDGRVTMAITIEGGQVLIPEDPLANRSGVDLILVLDRSGSMQGEKITDAKTAIRQIINLLSPQDRLALVSYSDQVKRHTSLLPLTPKNRQALRIAVDTIQANGATNLSGGLEAALPLLPQGFSTNGQKVILVSDGIANRGITAPQALARIAEQIVQREAALSTVGVGLDFNEELMTLLADHGQGVYHFLEDPSAFAQIFQAEFLSTREAVATGIQIRILLPPGVTLLDASGYPVENQGNLGIFSPGSLLPGQQRDLFLTFQVPTQAPAEYQINKITVDYRHNKQARQISLTQPLTFSSIKDETQALKSIDKKTWEKKVLKEDMNRLKNEVAQDIRAGKKEKAQQRIEEYQAKQTAANAVVGSEKVKEADEELEGLKDAVQETFSGAPAAVQRQRKKAAKTLQHESYEQRRDLSKP